MTANPPTKKQRARWEKVRALGCIVEAEIHEGDTEIHHTGTGMGGRRNHDKVLPLCYLHHRGAYGIDGKQCFTKRTWQEHYGTEDYYLLRVADLLGEAA